MIQSNALYLGDLYADIGGEAGIRQLVAHFYARMDAVPQFASLRALHPASLEASADKLFCFLSGWLGGPDLFVEKYGSPQLRARHLPFAIGVAERDQWVACMVLAMEDAGVKADLRHYLLGKFFKTADFMRNKPD
ncbi:MAG: group II truncated hemoglobin [Zoogloeaceae bacterium]|jgi:hemoglobin|nr:group II truncated hemoglobin [Zoogloeaceae bacterium]